MSTPLNPDALEAACRTLWESTENYPQQWEHVSPAVKKNLRKTVSKFASAYLAAALPEVTSVEPQEHYLCVCGKYITLTKAGVFRHHRGKEKEYPGSPWSKVCEGAGKKP